MEELLYSMSDETSIEAINSATTKELRTMARRFAHDINARLEGEDRDSTEMKELLEEVYEATGQKRHGKVTPNTSGKTKPELRYEVYNLKQILNTENATAFGKRLEAETSARSWEKFHAKRPDWTHEEWRQVTNIMGSLGKKLVEQYGSETIVSNFAEQVRGENAFSAKEFFSALVEAGNSKEAKTPDDLIVLAIGILQSKR